MFIAIYEEYCSTGETIEEAYKALNEIVTLSSTINHKIVFIEGNKVEVEYRIQKKEIPQLKKDK